MEITKDTVIGDIIRENPAAIEPLMQLGMGCVGCPASQSETLEEAAYVHGLDADAIVKYLNEALNGAE